jgi:hypothetical protein
MPDFSRSVGQGEWPVNMKNLSIPSSFKRADDFIGKARYNQTGC